MIFRLDWLFDLYYTYWVLIRILLNIAGKKRAALLSGITAFVWQFDEIKLTRSGYLELVMHLVYFDLSFIYYDHFFLLISSLIAITYLLLVVDETRRSYRS